MLTASDKTAGRALGLTLDEMRIAKATRISFERYSYHKEQIILERERELEVAEAHGEAFNAEATRRAALWVPAPDPEEEV